MAPFFASTKPSNRETVHSSGISPISVCLNFTWPIPLAKQNLAGAEDRGKRRTVTSVTPTPDPQVIGIDVLKAHVSFKPVGLRIMRSFLAKSNYITERDPLVFGI